MSANKYAVATKATWEQEKELAMFVYKDGATSEQIIPWLKKCKYEYQLPGEGQPLLKYNAIQVSAMVAGLEMAKATLAVDPVAVVNERIKAGVLKYTKARLVHTV